MDQISSSEFRKAFGKLTTPTVVTVNGHVIGTWMPRDGSIGEAMAHRYVEDIRPGDRTDRFNTQPFRGPIPKKR